MSMLFAETSRTGSAAMSRVAQKNPLELLRRMRDADSTADPERIFKKWYKQVVEDEAYLLATLHHAYTNMWVSLERDEPKKITTKEDLAKRRKEQKEKVTGLVKRITNIVLLDVVLPCGKRLRDATFAECAEAGGWFSKIAKMGRPNQLVGKILSEEDLHAVKL
jgi:hypothetical protein